MIAWFSLTVYVLTVTYLLLTVFGVLRLNNSAKNGLILSYVSFGLAFVIEKFSQI